MRLVCPNCEAKYEVPEDAIPESGRDVQCANCGHAWFQMRSRAATFDAASAGSGAPVAAAPSAPVTEAPAADAPVPAEEREAPAEAAVSTGTGPGAEPSEPDVPDEPAPGDVALPAAETPVVAEAEAPVVEPETPAEADPVEVAEVQATVSAAADDKTPGAPEAVAGAAAYAVDESVLAILREEAEREARARAAEAAKPLEVQPDLGIDEAIPAAAPVVEVAVEDPSLAARRARLPDVEEINSTLRPSESAVDQVAAEAMPVAAEGRSSFRSGFLLVLSVAILGSAVYGSADAIAEAVPALAGPLKSYVGFVDGLRMHLDGLMQSATVAINGS